MGLWVIRELSQTLSERAGGSAGRYPPPSRGSVCSVSLPGKTRRMLSSSHVLVFDPEVELIYSSLAFEARPLPGLAVHDEPALRGVHNPVPPVASGADRGDRVDFPLRSGRALTCIFLRWSEPLRPTGPYWAFGQRWRKHSTGPVLIRATPELPPSVPWWAAQHCRPLLNP